MEYSNHKVIKRIIAHNNAFTSCTTDILNINPNIIPKYARIISRFQSLIRRYDMLNNEQQTYMQIRINIITKQLTLLLKQVNNKDENPASTIYLLGLIGHAENELIKQLSLTAHTPESIC